MKRLGCLALCLLLLTGCAGGDPGQTVQIFAMDTLMELTAYGSQAQDALDVAVAEVNGLDTLLSAQREDSEITAVNRRGADGAAAQVSEETGELLTRTLELCADTEGALDITIHPAMQAWGFYSGEYRIPEREELSRLQKQVDYALVSVEGTTVSTQGQTIDLGAVGKGYAADRIVAIWREMGVTSGLLYLGGNIHCLGAKPDGSDWAVSIRDPNESNGILATVTGRDMAVVTSGGYQRYFEENGIRYHHILDPETCVPANNGAVSVTVIGSSGFTCDALSTALFVMGLDGAAAYWRGHRDEFDMVYYTEDGILWYTSGLQDRLELRRGLEGRALT